MSATVERSCLGKRRYVTKREAENAVIRIAKQEHDETIQRYRCRYCGFWHLGHRREAWQR